MSLSHDEVQRIARLARIAISDADAQAVLDRINRVLGLIDQMRAVDTEGVEPMAHALDVVQRLRPDAVTEPDRRTQIQAVAPAVEDGLYIVPRVLE